ncbi:carbohydrate-binding protein [Actinoplanes sp. NPDC049118]|uniref:carbohydrate-binding protein n=1 Tax=Actinoplanes sp. NPDC049118 TaxID=3155769 RepID=UPI0033F8C70B
MPRHSLPQQPTWLRPRLVVAFVVASAGLATAIWLPTRNDSADASERNRDGRDRNRNPSLTAFADEFDGRRGSTVDPAKWSLDTDEAANGVDFRESTRNARLDGDGNLTIVLRREDEGGFSSARLLTRDRLRGAAGHVEARIKTPEGGDPRPVFELIGADRQSVRSFDVLTEPLSDDYHTYALDWAPGEAVLSVDGEEVDRVDLDDDGLGTDEPFRLALSLALEDDRTGDDFPARMHIDSVSFSAADASAPPTTAPPTEPTTPPTTEPTAEPTTAAPTSAPTTSAPATTPPTTPPTTAPRATPNWAPFADYVAGQPVKFKGVEYQVLETHTSLPGWEPTALPGLFKKL